MRFAYYPGCSSHGSGREQDGSTRLVCAALGIELTELEDWSCCGATAAHAIGGELAVELGRRNLAIAARTGLDLLTPGAACFHNLRAARLALGDPAAPDAGAMPIWSVASLLARPAIAERIARQATRPLAELRVVTYYGCLLVRPPEVTGVADPEHPDELDRIAVACGATVVDWPYKTRCCGGGMFVSHPDLCDELSRPIVEMARRVKADLVVTACPICHSNLEIAQWRAGRRGGADRPGEPALPVLYVTELVGWALGLEMSDGLRRHLLDPSTALLAGEARS